MQPMIAVGQKPLSLADFSSILRRKANFTLDEAALENVAENFRFLDLIFPLTS
jgi:histidine ammonia-lyase